MHRLGSQQDYAIRVFVLLGLRHEGRECRKSRHPSANILKPKELIEYPTTVFAPSEPRDPSANMLIHKDLTFY